MTIFVIVNLCLNIELYMSNCIIDFLKKNLLSVLCIIGIVVELIYPGRFASILLYILGIIGFFYCAYYLLVFFCPPKRDWILVKGNYMNKVFNFVMLVPFVITLFVHCIYGTEFSPKNLIFDEKEHVLFESFLLYYQVYFD